VPLWGAMTADDVDFDMADLAAAMNGLTSDEIDTLPFGVIAVDRFGTVLLYNRTELAQSGYTGRGPVGHDFFKIGSFGGKAFRNRIEEARQLGKVDLEIGWFGDYSDPGRSLRIRVQSGAGGRLWLFIQRDPDGDVSCGPKGERNDSGCRCPKADG
jgi:photoactive yellow protein